MNTATAPLKPGIDKTTGEPFRVWIPARSRNVQPEGEHLPVDAYISRRILSGELVRAEIPPAAPAPAPKATNKPTTPERDA